MKIFKITFLFILISFFFDYCLSGTNKRVQIESIATINEFLPDSIKLVNENGENAIEFCPDNTCELFVAKKEVNL
jgi:hypothetical protein